MDAEHSRRRVFKCIHAEALARYLDAVRVLLRPLLAGEACTDIADMIVAELTSWHAALPHSRARLRSD